MTTRTRAAGVLLAALVLTAGCSALLGEGPLEFSASEATIPDGTLSDTGFELAEERDIQVNRSVEVGNETRDVRITSHVAGYRKAAQDTDRPSYVVVLSTPQANVAGQSLNPLGFIDKETLVTEAISRLERSNRVQVNESDIRTVGTDTVTVLDTEANVTKFDATATHSGEEFDVFVHALRVEHGDDYVVAVGVYPKSASDAEGDITTMFEAIEHDDSEE